MMRMPTIASIGWPAVVMSVLLAGLPSPALTYDNFDSGARFVIGAPD
jgi:hypothetical protein